MTPLTDRGLEELRRHAEEWALFRDGAAFTRDDAWDVLTLVAETRRHRNRTKRLMRRRACGTPPAPQGRTETDTGEDTGPCQT